MNQSIFLSGMMGSGKSFLGKQLADQLQLPFIDLDDEIENAEQMSITDIFTQKGEAFFRSLELSHITAQLEKKSPAVIALGGGAVCFNSIDKMLENMSTLVYLQSSPHNIFKRIKHQTHRPLLLNEHGEMRSEDEVIHYLSDLISKREIYYHSAHIQLNVDEFSTEEIIEQLREEYELRTDRSGKR